MKRKKPFESEPMEGLSQYAKGYRGNLLANMRDLFSEIGDSADGADNKMEDIIDDELMDLLDNFVVKKEEWSSTHPCGLVCGSDKYYSDLVNMLKMAITMLKLPDTTPADLVHEVAMSVVAYLEDLVSGIGVWNVVRSLYKRKYGTQLPFYDCEHGDYYEDDINIEDVKFIVWQCFCRCGQPEMMTFSPYSQGVEVISELVFDILVDSFEKAPEATRVKDYISRVFRKGDYFEIRQLAEWIVFKNKLTSCPNMMESVREEAEGINGKHDLIDETKAEYFVRSLRAWTRYVGPMGCMASVYLAEMCRNRGNEALAAKLDGVECIGPVVLRLKEAGKKDIILSDATGEEYMVSRNSFGPGARFDEVKGYMTSIVKFGDLWYQNGIAVGIEVDPFDTEKGYIDNEINNSKNKEWIRGVVESHGGRRIFYCRDMEEVSGILGVTNKSDTEHSADNYVLMLSEEEGMSVLEDSAESFKDKKNPFYDKQRAKEEAFFVIFNGNVPSDISDIIVKENLLPDANISASQGKRFGKAIVQDNMGFLFDFFRTRNPRVRWMYDED